MTGGKSIASSVFRKIGPPRATVRTTQCRPHLHNNYPTIGYTKEFHYRDFYSNTFANAKCGSVSIPVGGSTLPTVVHHHHHHQQQQHQIVGIWDHQMMTKRGMAIKRRSKQRQSKEQKDLPLMNEKLVKKIMSQSDASNPKDVTLRLVVEKDSETPVTSEETTLAEAIETSLDLGLDLVEIDMNQQIPVVRAVHYEAKLYRAEKDSKAQAKKNKDPAGVLKQFRFKARTADHDFQRKLNSVLEALQKGHRCKISATCPSRVVLSTNPKGAEEVIDKLLDDIGSAGESAKLQVNQAKTHATVLLVPPPKK